MFVDPNGGQNFLIGSEISFAQESINQKMRAEIRAAFLVGLGLYRIGKIAICKWVIDSSVALTLSDAQSTNGWVKMSPSARFFRIPPLGQCFNLNHKLCPHQQ
jgi:hypothetical protein